MAYSTGTLSINTPKQAGSAALFYDKAPPGLARLWCQQLVELMYDVQMTEHYISPVHLLDATQLVSD